jgi:hypothetical protein
MAKISVEIIATNGRRVVRVVWFRNVRGKGIYGSFYNSPDNLHFSYHSDGTVHTKIDPKKGIDGFHNQRGYASCGLQGPPLNDFKGHYTFMQGGISLDDGVFNRLKPYSLKKADRLILIDSRSIISQQRTCWFYFDLIHPNNYDLIIKRMRDMQHFICSDKRSICEHHCFFEQHPWLIIHVAYRSKRI